MDYNCQDCKILNGSHFKILRQHASTLRKVQVIIQCTCSSVQNAPIHPDANPRNIGTISTTESGMYDERTCSNNNSRSIGINITKKAQKQLVKLFSFHTF